MDGWKKVKKSKLLGFSRGAVLSTGMGLPVKTFCVSDTNEGEGVVLRSRYYTWGP